MVLKLVCQVGEIPPGQSLRAEFGEAIAVFNADGCFYATQDRCTHAEVSLAEGYIEGDSVECIAHFARFCLRTGEVLSPPACRPLKVYRVEVQDGNIYVDVP